MASSSGFGTIAKALLNGRPDRARVGKLVQRVKARLGIALQEYGCIVWGLNATSKVNSVSERLEIIEAPFESSPGSR